jgi:hypothetical protein
MKNTLLVITSVMHGAAAALALLLFMIAATISSAESATLDQIECVAEGIIAELEKEMISNGDAGAVPIMAAFGKPMFIAVLSQPNYPFDQIPNMREDDATKQSLKLMVNNCFSD